MEKPNSDGVHKTNPLVDGDAGDIGLQLSEFLVDRQARGLSPRTISWYREKLNVFSAFAKRAHLTTLADLAPNLIRVYLIELAEGHNPGGVHGFYRALRAFTRWWLSENGAQHQRDPFALVRPPKVPDQVLEPVPLDDLGRMLLTCESDTLLGLRDRAILLGLLDSGCRAQELVDLCVGDYAPLSGMWQVRSGKGGKPRAVFLGERAREALQAYLSSRSETDPTAPLFATQSGTRLTYAGLREIVRRRAKRAGIPPPSLHSFRRAFALCCLRQGMDIYSLQRLMGHADLTMLRRYLAQNEEDLKRAHDAYGPVDRMLFDPGTSDGRSN